MKPLAVLLCVVLCLVTSCSDTATKLAAPSGFSASLTRTDDLPLTVSTAKVKGQTVVTVSWDASLVRTDSVAMARQNQSTSPTFVNWIVPNTGSFVDTLPKGKTATHYYYWYCEYPAPADTHCAYDWVPAI